MKYFLSRGFSKTITAVFSAFVFLLLLTAANFSHATVACGDGQWYYIGFVTPQCFNSQAECVAGGHTCQQNTVSDQTNQTGQSTGQTQVVSCAGGTGTCMVSGCAATDSKPADPVCGIYDCCVPASAQTVSTCANSGGTCFAGACGTGSHSISQTCPNSGTCCVADTAADQNAANTDTSANNAGNNTNQSGSLLSGLVQCGTGEGPDAANQCGFNDIISLIQRIINFLLFAIAVPLAAISFAYAGYLYLTAGVNPSNIGKAKTIFVNVIVFGLPLALAAWLIVHAIVAGLGVPETYNFLGS